MKLQACGPPYLKIRLLAESQKKGLSWELSQLW